jgi:hypothetical protein
MRLATSNAPARHCAAVSEVLPLFLLAAFLCALPMRAPAQDVLTYHYNNARTGLDSSETTLTPSNVSSASFGRLFTLPTDGFVDGQLLYLSNLPIGGAPTNVVIVPTESASIYAYNADTGVRIWHDSMLRAGEIVSGNRGCAAVSSEGITSTPVIFRPKTGDPVIYTVAMTEDSSGKYHQRLHAIDAINGAELYGAAVDIEAKYPGTGDNSSGGYVIFDPSQYRERAGLLLIGHTIYLAFASHCDVRPYTGWIMGYNAQNLQQTTVLNLTPNGDEGGIWGSGAGMAADANGNIFLADGNGYFDTTMNASGFPSEGDYGNAFLKLTTTGGLAVADYFEMYNQVGENSQDLDLGSGGTVLVTPTDSTGKVWQLAVAAGKDSNIYVVDRTNMGKFNTASNQNYQELSGVLPGGIWSMPAAYNGRLYYGPVGSPIYAFQFQNAKLLPAAVAQTTTTFAYPGATPTISSNGNQNGILWALENVNPAVLHAYNATNLQEIYNSNQASGGRDQFGVGNKFVTPTVANGKVYVGSTNGVGVFGLLSAK